MMGTIQPPQRVLPLLAAFSRYPAALDFAKTTMEQNWGPVQLVSPVFDFRETDYYHESMGDGLLKQFFVLQHLHDPAGLADWKRQTNQWECSYAKMAPGETLRPLNADPGYLTLAKLVLATTKDHAHRLYLRDGIYAEVTLFFHQRQWRPHPWTFPDYARDDYRAFFLDCRDYLRSQLQESGPEARRVPREGDRL